MSIRNGKSKKTGPQNMRFGLSMCFFGSFTASSPAFRPSHARGVSPSARGRRAS